jgi:acyl-CoA hydrolase
MFRLVGAIRIRGMDAKPAAESRAEITHLMGVTDANNRGNIHGGTIMKLADEAAALAAIKHSRQRVVTVGMDRMDFLVPIYVGELVTFRATVNAAWRTSMEVGVRVESENIRTGEVAYSSAAYLTMVALDDEGRPTEVPGIAPETPEEERREREAQLRRDNRLAERASIEATRGG